MKKFAVIGLGNPGREYKHTRHNLGYMAVDMIAQHLCVGVSLRKLKSAMGEKEINGALLILCKPRTYMNLSGLAVKAVLSRYRVKPADLLVICDDFNLPMGSLRIKRGGSPGGHKGLASITGEIGTDSFPRLRIGIGPAPPHVDSMEFVLGEFTKEESGIVLNVLEKARDAVILCMESGIDLAMNRYNAREAPMTITDR
jgi:peptidyl-tRNA hydrolase, PTH1 family